MNLDGKVAMVTGGVRRIGREIALALARKGCHIVIHTKEISEFSEKVIDELKTIGVNAWVLPADLNCMVSAGGLLPMAIDCADRIDILVNNASVFPPGDFAETTLETWDYAMNVNLKSVFLLSQAFARQAGEVAKIINIIDSDSMRPKNHHFAYTISKCALVGLTHSMATAQENIQVNGIAPGLVLPPDGEEFGIKGRKTGSVQDVVDAALYLLLADYVNGEIIRVDGGQHLVV